MDEDILIILMVSHVELMTPIWESVGGGIIYVLSVVLLINVKFPYVVKYQKLQVLHISFFYHEALNL